MVTDPAGQVTAWGSLTDVCRAFNLPYHSLKAKKYPILINSHALIKAPFRPF